MQLTTIRSDARFHVSPQLTSTDYPDATLDANINLWYRRMLGWIIPIQGDWEIRGDIIYRDFQAGVSTYELPSIIRIFKGEVMYTTGGAYVPLKFTSVQREQDIAEGNATRVIDDAAHPTADLIGDFIDIKPTIDASGSNVVNGIKLWVQSDFVDIDTVNDIPDLMEPVHRLLSYGAAYDYCISEEMWNKAREIKRIIFGDPTVKDDDGIKGEVEALYSLRSGSRRDRLVAKRGNYR